MENVNLDFVHLIRQGAISTYPLLACSVVMLAVVIERLWALRGAVSSAASLTGALVPMLALGQQTALVRHLLVLTFGPKWEKDVARIARGF